MGFYFDFFIFSESGEMCAMKEVTLFSDDPKSRESAQQLGQVSALLFLKGKFNKFAVAKWKVFIENIKIFFSFLFCACGKIGEILQPLILLAGSNASQSFATS